eukprot:g31027.t2
MQMCDLCPPADAVKEGEKTYYFVNHKGQFIKAYKTHGYDPRKRPWYEAAKEAKGELVWLDIYSHSSGHTLGMTAAKAITSNNEVVAVVAADFTISYFSGFLKLVTRMISQEEGFIIDFKTGLMVASSSGIGQVAKKIVDQGLEAQGLPGSFQAKQHWLVVVTCPVKAFMEKSWEQQAWAEQRSAQVRQELRTDLAAQEVNTIWTCVTFTFLGALIMICIGLAVTRPLKRISTEMLSMAKLEFLPQDPLKAEIGAGKSLRRRSSTSFVSLRYVGRLMSTLTGSVKREDTEPGSSSSSSSGSDTDSQDEADCSLYVEEGGGCWTHATPKEVINIREAFIYMVAGLKSFARYMDPEIMRILVKSRRQAQLGMGKAEVTVFFSDIANFTTIAESLEPETFMSMLTEYLDEMSKIIMAKRGVVGEFIGDAIMAWWNVPINLGQEHTATALDAALAQQNRLAELRETWHLQRLPDVRVRMGLVKGNVLAGNIGSSQRMKYGLVGDSVNLASRLEGLCKYYGVSIIIEQDAAFAPGVQSRFQLRLLDLVIVKGRTQPTELYQLVCEKAVLPEAFDSPEDLQFFIDAYSQIHRLYRLKSFDACASALHHYRQRLPDDVGCPKAIMERTLRLVALLREAEEVKAPKGVPCDGKVVSFDNALAFLQRYNRFLRDLGPKLASPQVTFHWTAEENFQSIVESNLRVPKADPTEANGVKKKHGAAFGRGIYTCPDYKMAKEDFSYGASATFACLALPGRQLTRHHDPSEAEASAKLLNDAVDSAVTPCTLEAMEDTGRERWRRSERESASSAPSEQAFIGEGDLPYGGDLQAAMRAQDRPAVKMLMSMRDQKKDQVTTRGGRRWGARKAEHLRNLGS